MPTKNLNTGTAADILTFETFHHVEKKVERLTRVTTTSQELIVKDTDGERYVIKFEKNFSKKHLFTFSKDADATRKQAEIESKKPGQTDKVDENWHAAEMALLINKISKNIDKRAVAEVCACGCQFEKHQTTTNPKTPCACRGRGGIACPTVCTAFRTPYGIARTYVNKPTEDPLSGAKTSKNTCIILNWVPKAEFEAVVVQSIIAHEKHGWTKGDALKCAVGDEKTLDWDFTVARDGAVINMYRVVGGGGVITYPTANYRGCKVKAKKTHSNYGVQTWEISHMEATIPPTPAPGP
jgi:hypothetical protein